MKMDGAGAILSEDAGEGTSGGQGGDEQADESDASEGKDNVAGLDDDGIVFDDETARHADDTDVLLDETEDDADSQADDCPEENNHPALIEKDAAYEARACPEVLEGGYVVPLFDDEHGERAEHITGHHDDDEQENHEDDGLFNPHHAVDGLVLHVFVLDCEARTEDSADFLYCLPDIGVSGEPQLHFPGLIVLQPDKPACPFDRDEEGMAVSLVAGEKCADGEECFLVEGGGRIEQRDVPVPGGEIHLYRVEEPGHDAHFHCEPAAGDCLCDLSVHEGEFSVHDAGLYLRVFGVTLLHAFQHGRAFFPVVGQEDSLLDALSERGNGRHGTDGTEGFGVGAEIFCGVAGNGYVGHGPVVHAAHHVLEAVVYRQYHDQGAGAYGNAYRADERDDVDDVVRLLGEEVTPGYEVGQVHELLCEQLVDVLHVVQRVVYIEDELWNDTQLLGHLAAQLPAHGLARLLYHPEDLLLLG